MTAAPVAARAVTEARDVPAAAGALERGLDDAARLAPGALAAIAVPAPIASAAAMLRLGDDAILWEPRDRDQAWAGYGVAGEVVGHGATRFADVAAQGATLLARVVTIGDAPAPRCFGGASFAPGASDGARWAGFGDAAFVLPRWTYVRDGERARLVLTIGPAEAGDRARLHAELRRILDALAVPVAGAPGRLVAQHDLPAARWHEAIEGIRTAIAGGAVRKIVSARARVVELTRPIDLAGVVAELGRRQPGCSRFAMVRGGVAFVGASPERLIRRQGRAIDSEALAGSIARRGDDDATLAASLLASGKDRGEHAWVVTAIDAALGPRCRQLAVPAVPTVRTLRHVLHLHTPISGTLVADDHVLTLAAALHPTPAVGGTPTPDALAWIAAHEPEPRGWYAAPVGWFDASGDGELAVAIRSGLIAGSTATLYAGAGIVAESDPDAELAETEVKLRALSGALGLDEGVR